MEKTFIGYRRRNLLSLFSYYILLPATVINYPKIFYFWVGGFGGMGLKENLEFDLIDNLSRMERESNVPCGSRRILSRSSTACITA